MSKANIYLLGAIIFVLIASGAYLLLSKTGDTPPFYPDSADINSVQAPITSENADESLSQTEFEIQGELDQADQEIKEAQATNANSPTQEDLNSINSL